MVNAWERPGPFSRSREEKQAHFNEETNTKEMIVLYLHSIHSCGATGSFVKHFRSAFFQPSESHVQNLQGQQRQSKPEAGSSMRLHPSWSWQYIFFCAKPGKIIQMLHKLPQTKPKLDKISLRKKNFLRRRQGRIFLLSSVLLLLLLLWLLQQLSAIDLSSSCLYKDKSIFYSIDVG